LQTILAIPFSEAEAADLEAKVVDAMKLAIRRKSRRLDQRLR